MLRSTTDKATHSHLRQHNQQLLLRAIYSGVADNRAALAQETGLAKPTVSELIGELLDMGLLLEEGRGQSTEEGGKRPRLLKFVPAARHVIGIALDDESAYGMLTNMDGQIVAQHVVDLIGVSGERVIDSLMEVINGLIAQLDAPLLCIGIGISGVVDADQGVVRYAPHLGWRNIHLVEILNDEYNVPIYIANSTELAAMAQFVYGPRNGMQSLAMVLVGSGIGVGLVINGAIYHGGGEIGHLCLSAPAPTSPLSPRLEELLGWSAVKQRAYALQKLHQGSLLPPEGERVTYLHIHQAAANQDEAALALIRELGGYLAHVFAWIIGLLRPDHVALAGHITNLGDSVLDQTLARLEELILPDLMQNVSFSLAPGSNLGALGAVAQALQLELGLV